MSRIRPFCGRILLDQGLRINDLAVAASGENAAKLLNLTVPCKRPILGHGFFRISSQVQAASRSAFIPAHLRSEKCALRRTVFFLTAIDKGMVHSFVRQQNRTVWVGVSAPAAKLPRQVAGFAIPAHDLHGPPPAPCCFLPPPMPKGPVRKALGQPPCFPMTSSISAIRRRVSTRAATIFR